MSTPKANVTAPRLTAILLCFPKIVLFFFLLCFNVVLIFAQLCLRCSKNKSHYTTHFCATKRPKNALCSLEDSPAMPKCGTMDISRTYTTVYITPPSGDLLCSIAVLHLSKNVGVGTISPKAFRRLIVRYWHALAVVSDVEQSSNRAWKTAPGV